jgi:hypothetical protein
MRRSGIFPLRSFHLSWKSSADISETRFFLSPTDIPSLEEKSVKWFARPLKIVQGGCSLRNPFVLISEHPSRNKSVPAVRESGAKWNEHAGQCHSVISRGLTAQGTGSAAITADALAQGLHNPRLNKTNWRTNTNTSSPRRILDRQFPKACPARVAPSPTPVATLFYIWKSPY